MQTLKKSTEVSSKRSTQNGKRILHLAGTSRGATWMAEQLRELQSRGYKVKAYITDTGPLADKLTSCGVVYDIAPMEVAWSIAQVWAFIRSIYGLAWRLWCERFDVVHAHLFPTIILARFAAWIADVPVRIVMIPGPFYMEAESPPLLEIGTAWMDTRIVPSCEFTRDLYRKIGVPENQLELIYYGPDAQKFDPNRVDRLACRRELLTELGVPEDSLLIGLVAYFYPVLYQSDFVPKYLWGKAIKNHETVIEAASSVVSRCPNAHFVFIGDGWGEDGNKHLESLKELVRSKGLERHITFLGGRADVPELIVSFDVSLQCSLNENLGGTIESLLMERPIVGARVGGIVDSVRHEETGLLFDSTNSVQLADAIVRLLTDRTFAARLGKNGRQLMLQKFSLERTASDLDAMYQRCFAEQRQSSFLNRPGYRFWIVAWRALACLWWIGFSASLFCRAETRGRLMSLKQQTSCHVSNKLMAMKPELLNGNEMPSISLALSITREAVLSILYFICESAIQLAENVLRESYLMVKRSLDIMMALAGLTLFAPVAICLIPFYLQQRMSLFELRDYIGAFNEPFRLVLLNRLPQAAPALLQHIAATLRLAPACWNVLCGDLSLVGPRVRSTQLKLDGNFDYLPERWHMAPGLTGWCQVNMHLHKTESKLNGLDFLYIAHSSLVLDAKILLKTCFQMPLRPEHQRQISLWIPD